jgi:hypothetical protein
MTPQCWRPGSRTPLKDARGADRLKRTGPPPEVQTDGLAQLWAELRDDRRVRPRDEQWLTTDPRADRG